MYNLSLKETADRITETELDFMDSLITEEELNEEVLKLNEPWREVNRHIRELKKQRSIFLTKTSLRAN